MISKQEFNGRDRLVSDAYPDFVNGLYSCAKKCGCVSEVYAFMHESEDADTGQVLQVIDDSLGNPEPIRVRVGSKPICWSSLFVDASPISSVILSVASLSARERMFRSGRGEGADVTHTRVPNCVTKFYQMVCCRRRSWGACEHPRSVPLRKSLFRAV